MKKPSSVRTIIFFGSLLLQLSSLCFQSRGAAGDVDLSFDPGSGVNGPVQAVAIQPDGKMIIAGQFTTVKGLARSRVARLNADGSGDSSFNAGTGTGAWEEYAHAVALQSDGKVLVSNNGGFSRLNSDGSPDTNFIAGIGYVCGDEECFSSVYSIAVQADGKVLVGGFFSTLNGTNYSTGVARLNANGSLDGSFNPGTGANSIGSVALQPDGKVLIGGNNVTTVNGPVLNGITRLNANGSLDSSFNPGTGPDNGVYWIALQSDGKVLIGGGFTSVNGTNRRCIARLNGDGSLDGSFNPGAGTDYVVRSIALQSDGKVFISGDFTRVNGTNRNRLARLNSDGGLDGSFNPATASGGSSYQVNSVVVQSDGKVLIGGDFFSVNGTNHNYVDRFNADGSQDNNFNPGREVATSISSLVVQPDGKVLIGGGIRLNADGSLDNTYVPVPNTNTILNPDIAVPGTDYTVAQCSAVQADGKVLYGGWTATTLDIDEFNNYYFSFGWFVSRVNADGSRDTNFNPAVGGDYGAGAIGSNPWSARDPWSPTVRVLAVQPDGKVLVGATFGIARLNANGTLDSSFNPGFGGSVYSMFLQPDGRVLVGSSAGLAWLNSDGSRDPCFNPTINNSYFYPFVVVLQPDGQVLIGGSFSTVNGVSRNGIARLNSNGSLDTSFDPRTGANVTVTAIAVQPDGNVLIAGDFVTVNGVVRPYLARLFGGYSGPRLRLFSTTNNAVTVAWPSSPPGFTLQQKTSLDALNWINVATTPATVGSENQVAVSPTTGQRFFRLFSNAGTPPQSPAPPAPAPQLTATAGDTRVSLSWTAFAGATGHHIQRATNYNGPYTTIASPSTASYTDTTVVNGTTYYYIASAIYPCGESANSFPVGSTPQITPTVHVQSITMSFVAQGSHYYTRAVVKVVDNTGTPFSGATVTGNFTGSINNAGRTGVTAGNGEATITSSSAIKNGTVTFTAIGVAAGAVPYNPDANIVTAATISR